MCLIPEFEAKGAIIASALAEFLILIIQLLDIGKDIPMKIFYQNSGKYLFSGIVMFTITFGISYFLNPTFLTTIIQVIVGIITYGLMLILFKDEMLLDFLCKIKNKVMKNEQKN